MPHDGRGDVTARTGDYDANFDGQVDTHVDEGYEYGIDGELLGGAKHIDLDADGITDNRIGITVENTLVDDGVLLLANWYFLGRASVQ